MSESTHEETGDSPVTHDVDSAAEALLARRSTTVPTDEKPSTEPEPTAQSAETETDEVDKVDGEAEPEKEEAEETEAQARFESLTELAEAAGMDYDEFIRTVKTTTKVNGEEKQLPLADVIKGYQLESDFTRKNEAFLAKQKQWEQQQSNEQTALQRELQRAGQAFQLAQNQLTHEFQAINWEQLKADDPSSYLIQRNAYGERQAQLDHAINAATRNAENVMQQQKARQAQQLDQYTHQQDDLLLKAVPEWKKPEVRKAQSQEIAAFLTEIGYSAEEIGNIRDHRVILMARNAMKGKATVSSADLAAKKVKAAPKLLKPNARLNSNQAAAKTTQKLMQKAKQSGSIEDVAAALLSRRA